MQGAVGSKQLRVCGSQLPSETFVWFHGAGIDPWEGKRERAEGGEADPRVVRSIQPVFWRGAQKVLQRNPLPAH